MNNHHLAEPVLAWIADLRRIRSELADPGPADLAAHRRDARTVSERLARTHTAPPPAAVAIDEVVVRAGNPDRAVRVRRYRPPGDGRLPTQLWLHGGGFVSGAVDELVNDRLCAARCAASGVQILSVDYRLAPEHPYPSQVDDALAVFDAALTDRRLQACPERIGIGGNSAGATIAASTALRIRDTRSARLVHQLLEVPQVVFEPYGRSSIDFDLDEGPLAGRDPQSAATITSSVARAYLPKPAIDRYAIPLHADPAGLPGTMIMTAEFDPLRDGGEAYASRLRTAGVPVTLVRGVGHLHASCSLTATWEGARRWQRTATEAMITAYD